MSQPKRVLKPKVSSTNKYDQVAVNSSNSSSRTRSSTVTPTASSSTPMDFQPISTSHEMPSWANDIFAKLQNHENQLAKLEKLTEENSQLRAALEAAQARIQELEARATSTQPVQPTSQPNNGTNASIHNPLNAPQSRQPLTFAQAARSAPSTPRRVPATVPNIAFARTFLHVSPTQGFKFIYLYHRGKEPISAVRYKLRGLGVNPTSRIIDIHFPARQTVALLIHNDFEEDLIKILAQSGIKPLANFDPIDPSHLMDLKYEMRNIQPKRRQKKLSNFTRIVSSTCFNVSLNPTDDSQSPRAS